METQVGETTQAPPIVAGTASPAKKKGKPPVKAAKATKPTKVAKPKKAAKATDNGEVKDGSVLAIVLEILQRRKAGISLEDLVAATGWDNKHKVTMAMSGLRAKGYTIPRGEDGKYTATK